MLRKSRRRVNNALLRAVTAACMFVVSLAAAQVPPGFEPVPIGDSGCSAFKLPASTERFLSWSGACRDGFAHGPGTLRGESARKDGKVLVFTFEGGYDHGLRYGFGRKSFDDGSVFAGNYRNDRLNGWGYERYDDGSTFEGQFVDNLRNGIGKITGSAGVRHGRWEKGKPVGTYQQAYASSAWAAFVVQSDGKRNGILVNKDGDVRAGEFTAVSSERTMLDLGGAAILAFKDGTLFFGTFKDDRPHGPGVYVSSDSQNREDATLRGGTYDDGCLWRGNNAIRVNRTAELCRR